MKAFFAAILLLCLVSCSAGERGRPAPLSGCGERTIERLYFGLSTRGLEIPDQQWQAFLSQEVTPRFPDGLTVFEAYGQWRGEGGAIEREPARVVEIVHAADNSETINQSEAINQIVTAYKRRFEQEAVMVVRMPSAVCF